MTDYAILVSGWSGPGIEWRFSPIRAKLRAAGFITHHFARKDLGWGDISHIGSALVEEIDSIAPETEDSVYLVGHSMGGLVCRVANRFTWPVVKGIVTICTPHYGVKGAERAILSRSARQMCPESRFLEELNDWEPQKNIMSVFGAKDFLVKPSSAVWKKSNRVLKATGGHVTSVYDANVATQIVSYLNGIRES